MAENDIGIGPVLAAGCPPVPKEVSGRFTEVEMRSGPLREVDWKRDAQRISEHGQPDSEPPHCQR